MISDTALAVRGLTKAFRRKVAVDGVDFSVRRGEIVGFLGPNGSGKTTVMNMVMGLIAPDAGQIDLLGERAGHRQTGVRLRIGYLQEKPRIYPEMTARGYLAFFARLYGVAAPDVRVGAVLDRVGLTAAADRRLSDFSRGMQQRACLARVMLHEPEFLVLDEPTLGLDPNGVADMRQIFRDMQAQGATLLFSSHQLAEMERVCDSVIFMRHGRVIAAGRPADLVPSLAGDAALVVEIYEPAEPHLAALCGLPGFAAVRLTGPTRLEIVLTPRGDSDPRAVRAMVARAISGLGLTVLNVGGTVPTLEDLFLGLTSAAAPAPKN